MPPKSSPSRQDSPGRSSERSWRRSILGRLGVLALIPFVFYTLYTVAEKSVQTYRLRYEAVELRYEVDAEKRENIRLQHEILRARSDQEIEGIARKELNLVRPGDQPLVITGMLPDPTPTPVPLARPDAAEGLPAWLSWLVHRLGP
jgi:cell division protein FtsB